MPAHLHGGTPFEPELGQHTVRCHDPPRAMEALAVPLHFARGQRVYGREDPVDRWYRILSGLARKSTVFSDGRRRIVDFLLPGDFFGFSARKARCFDVEAVIEGTTVAYYPRQPLELLADSDRDVAGQVRNMAFESISRLQARLLILGRVTALEKVKAFLVEMAERSCAVSGTAVVLAMSRYDIADYLAVSVETVSRSLTSLQHRGMITLEGKHRIVLMGAEPDSLDSGACVPQSVPPLAPVLVAHHPINPAERQHRRGQGEQMGGVGCGEVNDNQLANDRQDRDQNHRADLDEAVAPFRRDEK
jgi:CRP/FNR family nitrogen fixation transcriptional regulator